MRTFKKAPPTIEFSDGLLLAAWLILATTPISTNSKGSNTVPGLWTGHGGVREALRHKYGDNLIKHFMSSAVLPSILHQDPRCYQLGHGVFWRRSAHAVECSSRAPIPVDSRPTTLNLGAAAAAAISTYSYHPESERGFGNVRLTNGMGCGNLTD